MSYDKPQLISRKRHYYYVLSFSIFTTILAALLLSGFFPIHMVFIKSSRRPEVYVNLSLILFALSGAISGTAFSFVLHRWMIVAYSTHDAREVPLSWMARHGRLILKWQGLVYFAVALLIVTPVYLTENWITRNIIWPHPYIYHGGLAFERAIERNDLFVVDYEIKNGADVNGKLSNYSSPLLLALLCRNNRMATFLIEKGARVDKREYNGDTPLHVVAKQGLMDAVRLLIEKNAKLNATDNESRTPLDMAIVHKRNDIIAFLRSHGGSTSAELESRAGESPAQGKVNRHPDTKPQTRGGDKPREAGRKGGTRP